MVAAQRRRTVILGPDDSSPPVDAPGFEAVLQGTGRLGLVQRRRPATESAGNSQRLRPIRSLYVGYLQTGYVEQEVQVSRRP